MSLLHRLAAFACLCLVLSALLADAFRLEIAPAEERCFSEEIPAGSDVKITFSETESYGLFLDVTLTHVPSGSVVWESIGRHSGSFMGELPDGGEYSVCLRSRSVSGGLFSGGGGGAASKASATRPVALQFLTGEHSIDFRALATREKLRPMEVQMRQLEEAARDVRRDYDHFAWHDGRMRQTNEHTTALVMWIAVAALGFFAVFSYLQYRHLKSYFRKKRLID